MSRRRDDPIPPFSPLERIVMRALAWELRPQFRDADSIVDEATAGRWFQGASGFVRRTGLSRTRPGNQRGQSGVFGSVHAVIPGLSEPVLFQLQLRRGRLIALMADAYGQDVGHIDFKTVRPQQLFYLDEYERSRPLDERMLARHGGRDGHAGHAEQAPRNVVIETVRTPPPQNVRQPTAPAGQSGLIVPATPGEQRLEAAGKTAERFVLKAAIWIVVLTVALLAVTLFNFPFLLAFIAVFWIGAAMTKGPGFTRMEAAFNRRRERLMN